MLGALTVDRRLEVRPSVVADARQLPFADESVDWVIADPPYSREWAKALYGITARQYPTPRGIVREAMRVLRPGGRLGLLHYMVPPYGAGGRLVGIWGIALGPGSSIRAWTVLEREPLQLTYVLDEDVQAAKEGAAPSRPRRAPRAAPRREQGLAEAVPRIPRNGGRGRLADRLDEVAGADPEDQEGVRR